MLMIDGDSDENHTFYFKSSLKNETYVFPQGHDFKIPG